MIFMKKNSMEYCEYCRKIVGYNIKNEKVTRKLKDTDVTYNERIAICSECGREIFVDELNDTNLSELYKQYRIVNDIISLDKIKEIPQKYNIGVRPLSLLLGWGELTYTRYYSGNYIPSKHYSEILKKVYEEPYYYLQLLENNKENITEIAYKKSLKATEQLLSTNCISIEDAAKYVVSLYNDITPLVLQKVLYYAQGFYFAFCSKFLFKDNCEAWQHGPVYRNIYGIYSKYKFNYIKDIDMVDTNSFSKEQMLVLNCVTKYFHIFNGKQLEELTHNESPWLTTRGDLPADASSNKVIRKSTIGLYFTNIKDKYAMTDPNDILEYVKDVLINF